MKVNVDENGRPISYEGTVKEIKDTFLNGEWIDVSKIPLLLGEDLTSRLTKWLEYKKSGIKLYDSTQK